jgi:DNA-binding transcriptional MerR regulator
MQQFMTAGDASYVLRVTPAAVRAMADRGDLEMAAETEGGIRLFRREDVEALAEKRYVEKELPPDEGGA